MDRTKQFIGEHGLEIGAPNLDGWCADDLMKFWNFARSSRKLAAFMFPDNRKGRVLALCALAGYAANKATAMSCRASGNIKSALVYEKICDMIYQKLPKWARW